MSARELVVVTNIVSEAGESERLLDWKRQEGEILRRTDGFVERIVARSAKDPAHFVNISRWSSLEGLARLQDDPAYGELASAFGLTMFPADVRDADRPVAVNHPAAGPFRVVSRMRAELLVAERATNFQVPEPQALLFSYEVDTGTTGRDAYVEFKRIEADGQLDALGFYLRYLAAVHGERSRFFYASVWSDRASADRFHETFMASNAYRDHYGRLQPFVQPPTFVDSIIELVTFPGARSATM